MIDLTTSRSAAVLFACGGLLLAGLSVSHAAVTAVDRVSVASGGAEGNATSGQPAHTAPTTLDQEGRFVAFTSQAGNFVGGDINQQEDAFVHDRQTGLTECVSVEEDGTPGNAHSFCEGISADGRYVAFISHSNLVPGDNDLYIDLYVRDRVAGTTEIVDVSSGEVRAVGSTFEASISDDGRYVAFRSQASNLVPGDTNQKDDIFVRDRVAGTTTRVSVSTNGTQANDDCATPRISGDGRFVAFVSSASNLAPGDINAGPDVFLRDVQAGTTLRISAATNLGGGFDPSINSDGRYIAFRGNGISLYDRLNGTITRIDVTPEGEPGSGDSNYPEISRSGRFVAFESFAGNLVPGKAPGVSCIYVRDIQEGITQRVSLTSGGAIPNGFSFAPGISGDGSTVAYTSNATNLVPNDTNGVTDIFAAEVSPIKGNSAPVADAGEDRTVRTKAKKAKVQLDGSGSSDPDGDELTYVWREGKTQIATGPTPTVKLKKGLHTITLEVRDPGGLVDTDEVVITVKKRRR